MIRLAFLIAGLVLLLHLIVQIGPHHIASSILRLGWSVIWVMLIYSASEMIRAVALRLLYGKAFRKENLNHTSQCSARA